MKKLILLLAAVSLAACSNDDGPSKKVVPTTITMVSTTNDQLNRTIHITYDSKRRVDNVDLGNGNSYSLAYDNSNRIAEIDILTGNVADNVTLTYDSQDRITALVEGNSNVPFTYADDGSFNLFGTTFAINSIGDVSEYSPGLFTFDTAKKGAFSNVSALNPFLMGLADPTGFFYATHKPVTAWIATDNSYAYSLQNTYNEKGYVTNVVMTGTDSATISYGYEEK